MGWLKFGFVCVAKNISFFYFQPIFLAIKPVKILIVSIFNIFRQYFLAIPRRK